MGLKKSEVLKKEQNKTILFGLISGAYLIIASFNPPIYPQVFYGLLCVLFGINYFITGVTYTFRGSSWQNALKSKNTKSFRIYDGLWVKVCGIILTLLGLWLILIKPVLPFPFM